jgi:endonuclease/exonuclease/phosphatase family metal-dependent hydrolase
LNRENVVQDAVVALPPGVRIDNPFAAGALEPNRRLDYIFVGEARANGAGHVTDCRIIGDGPVGAVFPSDHFGLVAEGLY